MPHKVAVLKGGWSSERDVSLNSGRACANALREAGYAVCEIDVTRDIPLLIETLTAEKPDVVFMALHGQGGEDGVMQGILTALDIPATHSPLMTSAVAMNKQVTKDLLRAHGMPLARDELLRAPDVAEGRISIPAPYVIKPNAEGSSVGVHIVREGSNQPLPDFSTFPRDTQFLVEEFVKGRELTVAVMGAAGQKASALTVTEIIANTTFYDYEAKYAAGGSSHILPADIPRDVFTQALRLAEMAHEKLGCAGVSRTDFRYDDSLSGISGLIFLETNTQPGMTGTSLVPEQAAYCGIGFPALAAWLVEEALWRHARATDMHLAAPELPKQTTGETDSRKKLG